MTGETVFEGLPTDDEPRQDQRSFARMMRDFFRGPGRRDNAAKPRERQRPAAGLWPLDHNGQYVSAKPTSKRNRRGA